MAAARIANPYLDYFVSLPVECRRDPRIPLDHSELSSPQWLQFKASVARTYAWAVPTQEAIEAIARRAPRIVEVGCGSGYWAWLLAQAGVDVVAIDPAPPVPSWHPIRLGTELDVAWHADRTLFLCWPPWATDMAYNTLAIHRGEQVVYVGEWQGGGNAEPKFFSLLEREYEQVERVAIPQWFMRADDLTIWRRRPRPATPGSAERAPGAVRT
jgi:hypothetical protein